MWVEVGVFPTPEEAELAQGYLQSDEIAELATRTLGPTRTSLSGCGLLSPWPPTARRWLANCWRRLTRGRWR